MIRSINTEVADRLDELAALVDAQGGSRYRLGTIASRAT
jgi:hypothetical protein